MIVTFQGVQLGDANAFRFVWGRAPLVGGDRLVYGFSNNAHFGEINFAVTSQADCASKMAAIETALNTPYGNLLVKNDDGSNTVNIILTAGTIDGVRCSGFNWGDKPGAQFYTWRQLSASFEWETRLAGVPSTRLIDFTESVTVQGGTPRTVVQEPINTDVSAADEFITVPKQKYVVVQRGMAVGLNAYPDVSVIAPPLYANPNTNPITFTTPKKVGATYQMYTVEWNYQWEFGALASLPVPNLWP